MATDCTLQHLWYRTLLSQYLFNQQSHNQQDLT